MAVEIADPKLSARYTATLIRDVTVGPAPGWMQRRLPYAGMRPINNVVDVTNYVMLEWGQPLHAFDYDVLVKRAGGKAADDHRPPGEGRRDAEDARRPGAQADAGDLVIADTAGPIALAGVMGGLETEVTAATKNVLLESASFDFVSVRRTAQQFNLFSEASTRFSRGVHPEVVLPGRPARGQAVRRARRRQGAARRRGQLPGPAAAAGHRRCKRPRSAGCSASTSRTPRSSAS